MVDDYSWLDCIQVRNSVRNMLTLVKIRYLASRPPLNWSLGLILLFQAVFIPYLSQPRPVQMGNGNWVMMCGMQGMRMVSTQTDGSEQQNSNSATCPFCALSSDLYSVLIPILSYLPVSKNSHHDHEPVQQSPEYQLPLVPFLIRAPPIV